MLLLKNSIKKIFKSFGRFISISLIILIGLGVFVGLREATPGMLHTADVYYDEYNLMDFKITSTYGLNDNDIDSLKNLSHVSKVIPTYSVDILISGKPVRIHAIEEEVNNVLLVEGRMPESTEECLGDFNNYHLGDQVQFDSESEYLNINQCNIVGTIKSNLYINISYGISSLGDGKLSSFIFVDKSNFSYEFATEAYLIAKNTKELHSYKNEYSDEITNLKDELQKLKSIRETIRYEEVLKTATDEINKIKTELNDEIDKNTKTLNSSKKKLDSSKKLLEETKNKTSTEIENNYNSLITNKNNIIQALEQNGLTVDTLDTALSTLQSNIDNMKQTLEQIPQESEQYQLLTASLTELETQYNSILVSKQGLASIEEGLIKLNNEKIKFETEISKQESTLQKGYDEYYKGIKKLNDAKTEAEEKIKEAENELESIEKPVWYLLDRDDIPGYQDYKSDALKVEAISKVLPLFFVIVVMLMCLNTLTRLIEEERTEIGILQSNGFSKTSIILSYIYYVFTSTLIGVTFGLTIGYEIITKIIYGVFTSNYYLPPYVSTIDKLSLTFIIAFTFILMILVTVLACNKELQSKPALLLRPKPPKSGKKVFLERLTKFWNNLSFMSKITIRNLFRYKKRIVMTILGVSGCTALLLTGFGLNDSINSISNVQYSDIIKYKSLLVLKNEVKSIPSQIDNLLKENNVRKSLLINQNAYTYSYDNKKESVYVITPLQSEYLSYYINLKTIDGNNIADLKDDGAIITYQMAKQLKVKKGDMINIRNSDNELFILKVNDIVENYISHYIYISPAYYEQIFKTEPFYNNILTDAPIKNDIELNDYDLYMITNTKDILDTFDTFIQSINNLIILIIICACTLAFAVLYNLTIINVNERKREIATFKVLGFNDLEIFMFIYRETLLLTLFGSIFGLGLGIILHRFVLSNAETGNIMFMCNIEWYSYILSFIITILFSLIVQLIINKTLKKIDMIDSLKSVE